VLAEEAQAWDMNISGVPAMIVEGKFMIPGAQSPEVYVSALRRVAEKSSVAAGNPTSSSQRKLGPRAASSAL